MTSDGLKPRTASQSPSGAPTCGCLPLCALLLVTTSWSPPVNGRRVAEPRALIAGEPGASIIPALQPLDGEIVVDKPGKGMFYATGLHETLQARGITHLVFTGVTTEVCVQTSMREANDRGYECLFVEDGTESYFPEFKAATLAMIAAQGAIVGWHAPSAAVLATLDLA